MIHNIQESRDRVRYGSRDIEYYIKKSKRIKTSELIVDSDKIEVRTPLNKSIEDTRDIVRDKADWIFRKQKELKSSIPEIVKPAFIKNATLPYLGRNYHVRINTNQSRNALTYVSGKLGVDIISSRIDYDARLLISRLYEEWEKKMAYAILNAKTETFSKKLKVDVHKIFVKRRLKTRWASLTNKGAINFNINLIKAPQDVIDYIVLHEICHLKIKGHSYHYWDLVYRYMPDYQDKIDWLDVNGIMLIND